MSDNLEQMRATARQLAERVQTDPAFKEQIRKDPVKTLAAAGLPENDIPDFLRETGLSDVAGYGPQFCLATCFFLSN